MAANSFLEQKQGSPLGFGAVIMLHGAAIAAVLLVKGPEWIRVIDQPIVVEMIPPDEIPPVEPLPQPQDQQVRQPLTRMDVSPIIIDTPIRDLTSTPAPTLDAPTRTAGVDPGPVREVQRELVEIPRTPRIPARTDSLFDPRFAGSQQPPYPESEIRAEREGVVSLRITIGPDGRVVSAQRISATNDAFWRATERQALNRWRFRPATEDGRPVQSVKTMNIRFRLNN